MNAFKVPIKNIYYMLCYAWDIVDYTDDALLGDEHFDYIHNLIGRILLHEVRKLTKRGFHREYVDVTEEISRIKGHINFMPSIATNSILRKKMICTFDDYSSNVLFNQIIKSSIIDLIGFDKLNKELKTDLRNTLSHFSGIDYIVLNKQHFSAIKVDSHSRNYEIILNAAKLLRFGLITTNDVGISKFLSFIEEKEMAKIYEKFILNFYKHNLNISDFKVHSPKILWDLDDRDESLFPDMQTDIVIENKKKNTQLIIDAKYYEKALITSFYSSKETIRNTHVNQIYAYMSMSKYSGNIEGMLLYPTITTEIDVTKTISSKFITSFKTLNLNTEWHLIESRLLSLI